MNVYRNIRGLALLVFSFGVSRSMQLTLKSGPGWPGPTMMSAVQIDIQQGCPSDHQFLNKCVLPFRESIHVVQVPKPSLPNVQGMALIRNLATSVNPADWEGGLQGNKHGIIGLDNSAIVEQVTPYCSVKPGDHVWGSIGGASAAYSIAPCSRLGVKPASLSDLEAAAVPTAALTDLRSLYDLGAPWTNKPRILITAAAGGCGLFAVQLARALGAGEIITTSSPGHFDLLRQMGADRTLDYHVSDWWDALGARSVDLIYDIVPYHESPERALEVLTDGGKYLLLAGTGFGLDRARAQGKCEYAAHDSSNTLAKCTSTTRPSVSTESFLLIDYNTGDLNFLKDLVDQSKLHVTLDSVYTRDNASEAFVHSETTHTTGKMVIKL